MSEAQPKCAFVRPTGVCGQSEAMHDGFYFVCDHPFTPPEPAATDGMTTLSFRVAATEWKPDMIACPNCGQQQQRLGLSPPAAYTAVCGPTAGCGYTWLVQPLTTVIAVPAVTEEERERVVEQLKEIKCSIELGEYEAAEALLTRVLAALRGTDQ